MRKEFPYDPYEGQVFYEPETEKTFYDPQTEKTWMFARDEWVDITYEDITYDI